MLDPMEWAFLIAIGPAFVGLIAATIIAAAQARSARNRIARINALLRERGDPQSAARKTQG